MKEEKKTIDEEKEKQSFIKKMLKDKDHIEKMKRLKKELSPEDYKGEEKVYLAYCECQYIIHQIEKTLEESRRKRESKPKEEILTDEQIEAEVDAKLDNIRFEQYKLEIADLPEEEQQIKIQEFWEERREFNEELRWLRRAKEILARDRAEEDRKISKMTREERLAYIAQRYYILDADKDFKSVEVVEVDKGDNANE